MNIYYEMIVLTKQQFDRICPKKYPLGQCEWFRSTYGCTLEIKGKYYLTFKTEKEETFFVIKYGDIVFQPDIQDDGLEILLDTVLQWSINSKT